jgi:hypothetical protein
MFAMLNGPWPRVAADGTRLSDLEAAVAAGETTPATLASAVERVAAEAVAAQVDAGMDLVTDGGVRWADVDQVALDAVRDVTGLAGLFVRSWRTAAGLTDLPLAQVIPGPWSLAVRDAGPDAGSEVVANRALELAGALAGEVAALGEAGCPVVQVTEPAAAAIGEGTVARDGFRRAHARLLRDAGELHTMLAITGGSAAGAGASTVLGAPYASFLFDLIAGPDNWRLVRAVPGDRGVVCAALRAGDGRERLDQAPELVWAAHYAASSNGRGLGRVGLANASPLDGLGPDEAVVALRGLAQAARLATLPPSEAIREGLDAKAMVRGDRLSAMKRRDALRQDAGEPPGEDR